jgi:alpha-L-rhamnosidase
MSAASNMQMAMLFFLLLSGALIRADELVSATASDSKVTVPGAASVEVVGLKCEYLEDPLSIDTTEPRLSWRLQPTSSHARGQKQTRYQTLVASAEELLLHDKWDLWDSGLVQSDESVNVVYAGKQLQSGQDCFWKIRACDEHGNWSSWSKRGHWTMGLLKPQNWKAQWIGGPEIPKTENHGPTDNTMPDPWFRKTFELPEKPSRAVAYVASIGYHELYVNGQKIGDGVLAPSTTDHSHRARYVTYDITGNLKRGPNVIGLWLGVSWSIFPAYQTDDKPAAPIVLAQADIQLPQNGKFQVITDQTWKTHPSPNTLLGFWDAHGFGGERYDANLEMTNWCRLNLDDSAWKAASVFHPHLLVSADKTEPNRLIKEIKPLAVADMTNGAYRIDMGVNYAGWFEMKLSGHPGDLIQFQFSERENQAMSFGLHSDYIIGPSGKGAFRNRFNYMAGRWVQVTGLRSKPTLDQIRGWLIRTDYQRASDFECDQPLLNRIYNTTLWTFENLSLGGYVVDCPHRERRGYGDNYVAVRTALDNYQLGAFCTKWGEDWRDVQGPDGNVPHSAPTHLGGGGPAWSGFCVTLPWQMYLHYGDQRILKENFPTIQRWLVFLETQSRQDMLVRYGGSWGFLGDWQWPKFWGDRSKVEKQKKFLGDTKESLFFNNCNWILNLETAARIAEIIGEKDAADTYRKRADVIRAAVHAAFFNPADNSYVNGFPAYLAIALMVDLPPKELKSGVWQRLEQEIMMKHDGHIWAGIIGGGYLLNTLLDHNRNDLIYSMASKEDYPGWGDMLRKGATTFYEDWDCGGSYLHSSYLYIGSWFIEALGGIRRPEAGFKHFVIEPCIDLQHGPRKVRAHYDSYYGQIATNWRLDSENLNLELTIPPNTDAILRLHDVKPGSLQESGQPLNRARGVVLESEAQNVATLRLEPGRYEFKAVMNSRP